MKINEYLSLLAESIPKQFDDLNDWKDGAAELGYNVGSLKVAGENIFRAYSKSKYVGEFDLDDNTGWLAIPPKQELPVSTTKTIKKDDTSKIEMFSKTDFSRWMKSSEHMGYLVTHSPDATHSTAWQNDIKKGEFLDNNGGWLRISHS